MRTRLTDVVGWKGRTVPGDRVIPDHLKLAILTRGRIRLPTGNTTWLLDRIRATGETWPDRLRRDLSEILPEVHVTVELFINQRPELTQPEITEALHGYLTLRQRRHLPDCFVIYSWAPHDQRKNLEDALNLDVSLLFRKAGVRPQPKTPGRFVLLVYVCLPLTINNYLAPVRPSSPPAPSKAMPPLEALTSPSTSKNLRDGPGESSTILGTQVGEVIPVHVLDKREADGNIWFQIELAAALKITKAGQPATLQAGTKCWIVAEETTEPTWTEKLLFNKGPSKVGGGLEWVAAPWHLFRHQLAQFESANSGLSLNDRITKLRQMSHSQDVPFDAVIGARRGTSYLDTQPFDPSSWQLLKDYQAVRTPDGRLIDLHHLLVGLDVLRRPEKLHVDFLGIDVGSNWAAATWSGDLGAAATDMTFAAGKEWEQRQARTLRERAQHYFDTRAGDHDLMADVDAWGIHDLRSPDLDSIDALLASYYEHTRNEGFRTVTTARRNALERFLAHYGFTYDVATDYFKYPFLVRQTDGVKRVRSEIGRFARVWAFRSNPVGGGKIDNTNVGLMVHHFLYWLEYQTIENGVTVKP